MFPLIQLIFHVINTIKHYVILFRGLVSFQLTTIPSLSPYILTLLSRLDLTATLDTRQSIARLAL
jgi:hypothetical protein